MKKNLIGKIIAVCSIITLCMTGWVMAASKTYPQFSLSKFSMKLGATQKISGFLKGDDLTLAAFESSDPGVVAIRSDGTIKAMSTGISTLSYTYYDEEGEEKEIYCYVEVTKDNSTYSGIDGETTGSNITITLNLGDYTTTVEMAQGAVLKFPEVTKEGYILEGWYKDAAYEVKVQKEERFMNATTLYAKWITADEAEKPVIPHSSLYDDIDEHWAKNYIESVSYRGLFQGVSEKIFAPEKTMTRAMVITVLGRLDEVEMAGRTTDFEDVPKGSYYEEYVAWGLENKIITGTTETTFSPNQEVTREEMAVMMANYIKYKGYDYKVEEVYFSDVEDISKGALESVKILNNLKIMQGNANGTYLPKKVATRAEIATIFYNYLNFINR